MIRVSEWSRLTAIVTILFTTNCSDRSKRERTDNSIAQIADNIETMADDLENDLAGQGYDILNRHKDPQVGEFPSTFSARDAFAVVRAAGHACNATRTLERRGFDLFVTCSDGERYRLVRVLSPVRQDLAMKCSAMEKLSVGGGC